MLPGDDAHTAPGAMGDFGVSVMILQGKACWDGRLTVFVVHRPLFGDDHGHGVRDSAPYGSVASAALVIDGDHGLSSLLLLHPRLNCDGIKHDTSAEFHVGDRVY